jgi:lipopolysaccharide transport system ATP-binding protein
MSTNNWAIQAEDLGKCYRIFNSPRQRLIQALWGERRRLYREFWALRDVSFNLARGQTLGVVGRNGSGKSTLLQLLCGTLTPTQGHIRINGRVGALLELGSGFNPEFSGRENIYLNGAVLGLSEEEIHERLDDILGFADIGSFIEQPVKTYSSGMAVRLAFAVQAHIDPDILVVDEALAVGDELFQRKCYNRLERLKQSGTSILLVTHSCPQIIEHCDQALLLHRGRLRLLGEPQRVTTYYQQLANADEDRWDAVLPGQSAEAESQAHDAPSLQDPDLEPSTTVVHLSEGAEIIDLQIEASDGTPRNLIPFGEEFQLRFRYRATRHFAALQFGCHVASTSGQRITGAVFPALAGKGKTAEAGESWEIVFSFGKGLMPGTYFVGGGIWECHDTGTFVHRVVDYRALKVLATGTDVLIGLCDLSSRPAELRPAMPNRADGDGSV